MDGCACGNIPFTHQWAEGRRQGMTWEDVLRPCCCLVSNLCPTPCNTMGCGPPGSPCPWNFPGKDTDLGIGPVSPALADGFFTTEPPGKPKVSVEQVKKEDQKQPFSERFLVLECQVSSTFPFPSEPCLLALRQ